jgi:hypothetical protein
VGLGAGGADLLFRWFAGLGIDDQVWDASTFSKNRDRLLNGEIAAKFLATVLIGKGGSCRTNFSASTARSSRRGRR